MRVLPVAEVLVEDDRKDEPILAIIHAPCKDSDKSSGQETVYQVACCQLSLKLQLVRSIRKARSNLTRETRRPLSGSSQSDGGYGSDPVKDRKSS
ncbi:hypothetical protein OESDEN_02393 [Oesophagostomum dentatum]|uniref:Tiam1/2 second PH-like domain-containing protein n=1 Tax=Oesophagostomum dentatum TaxID=61180 RepID=A0A0B1TQJ1_OESDE|nr:hypothetical protein OESDEN_02393 [Oesophagostomum dentatum]